MLQFQQDLYTDVPSYGSIGGWVTSFGKMKNIKGVHFQGCLAECFCHVCLLAKQTKSSYFVSSNTNKPFELLHTYICGPYLICDASGCNQFLIMVDDYTKMTWTHLLKNEFYHSQVFAIC